MKTLFGSGIVSKFFLTFKVGQENSKTPESAPVNSSSVGTPGDFNPLRVEAILNAMWHVCIKLLTFRETKAYKGNSKGTTLTLAEAFNWKALINSLPAVD